MEPVTILTALMVISIFFTGLGYGFKATPEDAAYLFRRPGQLLRSLAAMNLIMPGLALLLALFTDLAPLVKIVLVAISVSPLPPLFPRRPLKAGGRQAYVTGLLVSTALLSVLLIPLTLEILERLTDKPIQLPVRQVATAALVTVVVPLLLGLITRRFAPVFAEKAAQPLEITGLVLLILAVLPLLWFLFPLVWQLVGNGTVLFIAGFVGAGIFAGKLLGGPAPDEAAVLSFATAHRHPGIAMAVAGANLPDQQLVAATLVLYLLVNACLTLPYATWLHRKNARNNYADPKTSAQHS